MMKRVLVGVAMVLALSATAAWAVHTFSDVPDDHPQADDIAYAVEQGWFQGYPDGTFKPDRALATHQAVTVFGRAFPDGVSRADLATILRVGQTALTTTTPTTMPTVGTGRWTYFDGTGIHGDYEGYFVPSTSSSAYDWQLTPTLYIRCGVENDEWDSAFISTPFLIFDDNDTDTATVVYRFSDQSKATTDNGWWSSEDSESALFASSGFISALRNTDGDTLYTNLQDRFKTEQAEFDITGLDTVLKALDCT